jgi:phospholipase/lecithinase/hemolysin
VLFSSWDHTTNATCKILLPDNTLNPFPNIDDKCARDKMHPGPKSQQAHAEQIIKAINDRAWI